MGKKSREKKNRELSQKLDNPYFELQENEGFPRQLFVYASKAQAFLAFWNGINHWEEYLTQHPVRTLLGIGITVFGAFKTEEMQRELTTHAHKNPHHNYDIANIKTNGAYNTIRNPIYLGFMVGDVGIALIAPSLETILAGAAAIGFKLATVHQEEKRLTAQFGDEYKAYCESTPRWIPKLSYFQDKMSQYAIKHPTLTHIVNSLGGI